MFARLPAPLAALVAVFRNPSLRRVLLAFIGFSMAEWGSWIAILVYAYGRGGAAEAGVAALVQLAPSAVVAPLAAVVGDSVRRERALLVAYVVQSATLGLTAAALIGGAPAPLVYLAAAAAATTITLTRPIQAAILPSLSRAPAELTAANVAAGTVETGSILVGPILAGVTLAAVGAGVVFAASAAVTFLGAVLVLGVRSVAAKPPDAEPAGGGRMGRLAAEALGGFGVLLREERPRSVLGLLATAAVLWGALDILLVVLAIDLLVLGEAGVGYLNAAMGAGGLVGSMLTVLLIGRSRLAMPFSAGVALWALPLLLIGLLTGTGAALALLAAAGLGRIVMDVAGRTLLQRVTPPGMLTRVFGVLEGIEMASLALGSIVAPALIAVAGANGAFVLAGASVLVVVAVLARPLRRLDAVSLARPREIGLLRAIPIFAPLGPPALERLAASLVPVHAPAGSAIIRQGDRGDRFYIIVDGQVAVDVDGRVVRQQGAGEAFGEIALLRDVPRTATVRAVAATELMAVERRTFLEAVTGQPASVSAAEQLIDRRLHSEAGEADAGA